MTTETKIRNGIRYGETTLSGVRVRLPTQAMTSTNVNHARDAGVPDFDFKTKFLVVLEKYPRRLISDVEYRKRRVDIVRKTLQDNGDKIAVFEVKGSKSLKPTKDENSALIRFQLACGFKYVTAFFGTEKNWADNFAAYRDTLPAGIELAPVLDLNLKHETFIGLYELALREKCEVICFMGRNPSRTNRDNKLNFEFIRSRAEDRVVRAALSINKSNNGLLNTLVFLRYRFDVCSFLTRYGNQNIVDYKLSAVKDSDIVKVEDNPDLRCVVRGGSLHDSCVYFGREMNKSSLPVQIHDVVVTNELLERAHDTFTEEQLAALLSERLRL